MATPERFPEANLLLGPPQGCETDVNPLPVRRLEGCLVSCWRLTAEELAEVQRTGVVWLSVWGRRTQPPVMVTAIKADVI